MKIKKGDKVLIISGKDRGRIGKIIQVFPQKNKIVVEGMNLRKKHIRPKRGGEKGQIVQIPTPFDISNAKLICPKCGKPTRVGYKIIERRKLRSCKRCNQEI